MSFHLVQEWADTRLAYDTDSVAFVGHYVLVDLDKYVYIWTPDSYIAEALSETLHSVTKAKHVPEGVSKWHAYQKYQVKFEDFLKETKHIVHVLAYSHCKTWKRHTKFGFQKAIS